MAAVTVIRSALEGRFPGTRFFVSWDRRREVFVARWVAGPAYDDVMPVTNELEEEMCNVRNNFRRIECGRELRPGVEDVL